MKNDLEDRLLDFATAICQATAGLPRTQLGRHISGQLLRSATGAAANYAEARAGESARDFIHKLKLTLKELREALFRLRLTNRLRMTPSPHCEQLLAEANELVSIFVVSIKTARRRQPKP